MDREPDDILDYGCRNVAIFAILVLILIKLIIWLNT